MDASEMHKGDILTMRWGISLGDVAMGLHWLDSVPDAWASEKLYPLRHWYFPARLVAVQSVCHICKEYYCHG